MSSRGETVPYKKTTRTLKLCDLPDDLLVRILSLLPTKTAVSTTLLSTRWQTLWTFTSNLEFYDVKFRKRSDFLNFVDKAIRLRKGLALESFILYCRVLNDAARINAWIESTVRSSTVRLTLILQDTDDSSFSLPTCLFTSQTIVKLDLGLVNGVLYLPATICFPSLKGFRLCGAIFTDDESIGNLLSQPLLEDLTIKNCQWGNLKEVCVCSPNLQHITVDDSESFMDLKKFAWCRKVVFYGDNVKCFSYKGEFINEYCFGGSTEELKEVHLMVESCFFTDDDHLEAAAIRYYSILNSIRRVQNLTLTEHFITGLDEFPDMLDTLPLLDCVTQLNLSGHESDLIRIDGMNVMKMYSLCPNLEHLNILTVLSEDLSGSVLDPLPSCFETHLKKLSIQRYIPGDEEGAIGVLLKSTPVLEELVIYYSWGNDHGCDYVYNTTQLRRKLTFRPRASKNCRITLL